MKQHSLNVSKQVSRKRHPYVPSAAATPSASLISNSSGQHSNMSSDDILNMQSTIGNLATMQLLRQSQTSQTQLQHKIGVTLQRRVKPMEGTSSGWFRKGRRDKLNLMVAEYNLKEMKSSNTTSDNQSLLNDLQKINQYAMEWQKSVKNDEDKAKSIKNWRSDELAPEIQMRGALITLASPMDDTAMKAASKNTQHDKRFSPEQYAIPAIWLQEPNLINVFRDFARKEFSLENIDAFMEMSAYRYSPSRDEALRIYDKYEMASSNGDLNINRKAPILQQLALLKTDPKAPVPTDFEEIKKQLWTNIGDTFSRFKFTEPYERISNPAGNNKTKK